MTEPIRASYEEIRDSYPLGEDGDGSARVGVLWRDSDRWRGQLRDEVNQVMQDETLSEEGKQQRVSEVYDRLTPKIVEPAKKAREKAAKLAGEYSAKSVPMPNNGTLLTSRVQDAAELSAIQSETTSIVEALSGGGLKAAVERRMGRRVKNVKDAGGEQLHALQAYFEDALETGGIEGKVQAHAVLRAAARVGVDPERVYDPFRTEGHTSLLKQAQRYQRAVDSISTNPPTVTAGSSATGNHWRKGGSLKALLTGGSNGFLPQKNKPRKPSWK